MFANWVATFFHKLVTFFKQFMAFCQVFLLVCLFLSMKFTFCDSFSLVYLFLTLVCHFFSYQMVSSFHLFYKLVTFFNTLPSFLYQFITFFPLVCGFFPFRKIKSWGYPDEVPKKRPDVLRMSSYGPICNAKGHILSKISLGHTEDVNLPITHYGLFYFS